MRDFLLLTCSCSSAEEGPLISYSPWTGFPSWHPASHVTTTLIWGQVIYKITRGCGDDRWDPNPAVVSDHLPIDFSALEIRGFVFNRPLHSGCWNHPQILNYSPSWKFRSAGSYHLPWNATGHKRAHDKGGARTGQIFRAKNWKQSLPSEIKVIFNLTFDGTTTEFCFPEVMESFLDH